MRHGLSAARTWALSQTAVSARRFCPVSSIVSVEIFAEDQAEHFHLTPMAELVRTEVPGSLRALAILHGEEWFWRAESALLDSVRTDSQWFLHQNS